MKRLTLLLCIILLLTGCSKTKSQKATEEIILAAASGTDEFKDPNDNVRAATPINAEQVKSPDGFDYKKVPKYTSEPYIVINNDEPYFTEKDLTTKCYRDYGTLDELGRTPATTVVTCYEDLPSGERGSIKDIKPSGWHQNKYPGIVNSEPPEIFNRAHLGMWAMLGNESNIPENLITGTRYFNTEGMLPNETIVLEYIKSTKNHVLYRVTPVYVKKELLARGVLMEAISVEDKGKSLKLCRWAYNVQPGIKIDYKTGENKEE